MRLLPRTRLLIGLGLGLCVAPPAFSAPTKASVKSISTQVEALIKQADVAMQNSALDDALGYSTQARTLAETTKDQVLIAKAWQSVCDSGILAYNEEAYAYCQKAYELRLKVLGPDDPDTYISLSTLASLTLSADPATSFEQSSKAAENLERVAKTPRQKMSASVSWYMAALALKFQGKYIESIPYFEKSMLNMDLEENDLSPVKASIRTDLADLYITLGDYQKAYAYALEAVEIRKQYKSADTDMADAYGVVGDSLRRQGRYDDAEVYFKQGLIIARDSATPLGHVVGRAYQNLALVYINTGRLSDARQALLSAVDALTTLRGNSDAILSGVYSDLAHTYELMGDQELALETAQKGYDLSVALRGPTYDPALSIKLVMARSLMYLGRTDEALAFTDEVAQVRLKAIPTSGRTAETLGLRARLKVQKGDLEGAEADVVQAIAILEPLSPYASVVIDTRTLYAEILMKKADANPGDREALLQKAFEQSQMATHSQTYVVQNMVRVQAQQGGSQNITPRQRVYTTALDAAWALAHK